MHKLVLDQPSIDRAVIRMAHEILEKNNGTAGICLVGIQRRGVILAQRLCAEILKISKQEVPAGILDIMPVHITPNGKTYAYGYRRLLSDLYVVTGLL